MKTWASPLEYIVYVTSTHYLSEVKKEHLESSVRALCIILRRAFPLLNFNIINEIHRKYPLMKYSLPKVTTSPTWILPFMPLVLPLNTLWFKKF